MKSHEFLDIPRFDRGAGPHRPLGISPIPANSLPVSLPSVLPWPSLMGSTIQAWPDPMGSQVISKEWLVFSVPGTMISLVNWSFEVAPSPFSSEVRFPNPLKL